MFSKSAWGCQRTEDGEHRIRDVCVEAYPEAASECEWLEGVDALP